MPAIGIFGAGWVGLVTGACFAELGHDVVVRDILPERIDALRSGRVPFHEPELEDLLERNRERLTFTLEAEDLAEARLLFVCVGTPPTHSGDADLSAVWNVVDELPVPEERALLIMKSTVPVGTGEKVQAALSSRGLAHVGYVSNPEFLAEGTAVRDFMHPDRVVAGGFIEADVGTVAALYEPLEAPLVRTDVASAEMIKLASNAFLMTRISFINEIANVCEATGADVVQVAKGVGLDHRLGPHFLRAGIGYGGSCFPKDVKALARSSRDVGQEPTIMMAVEAVNEAQKRVLFGKISRHYGGKLAGRVIALWGLAFKPNTDDMREAPSRVLMEALWAAGATVRAYDPVALDEARRIYGARKELMLCKSAGHALEGADALAICTEWQEFRSPDFVKLKTALKEPVVFDGRNLYDPALMAGQGIRYYGIGRGARLPA